jgi:hypothetical protein
MTLTTLFRVLVVAAPVLAVLGVVANHFGAAHVSQDWRDILAWSGDGAWIPDPSSIWQTQRMLAISVVFLYVIVVIAALVAQVGLFLFWRFARPLAVVLTVLGEALVLGFGLSVFLPLEQVFYDLCLLSEGAILALAYFSPLHARFDQRSVA